MTQTLEERIAEFKQIYADLPKAKDALEIIIELQAENQALLAKNRKLENLCEKERDIGRKLCARNYNLDSANVALEAKAKELEGKVERLTVLVEDLRDPFNKNRRGEKHGE